jgi:hypothetical protein
MLAWNETNALWEKRNRAHIHTAPLITHTQSDARPHSTLTVSHFRCHSRTANYCWCWEPLFGACATPEKKKNALAEKEKWKTIFCLPPRAGFICFLVVAAEHDRRYKWNRLRNPGKSREQIRGKQAELPPPGFPPLFQRNTGAECQLGLMFVLSSRIPSSLCFLRKCF